MYFSYYKKLDKSHLQHVLLSIITKINPLFIIIFMNFHYPLNPGFNSPEEAALYYNSICYSYDHIPELAFQPTNFLLTPAFDPNLYQRYQP